MLNQIGILIVGTLVGSIVYLGLLRFYMQAFRAPFRNPIGQFTIALTDWGVKPLRKVVPGVRGLDTASLIFAFLVEFALIGIVYGVFGSSLPDPASWLLFALVGVIRASIHLLVAVVIADFVLSWVNPYTPFAPVLRSITSPFYNFFRRFIPQIGGFDLSPLFVLLVLQILLIVLAHVAPSPF